MDGLSQGCLSLKKGILIDGAHSSCVCLFNLPFSGNKSAGSSQWTLVYDFFAPGLQQCQWTRAWALRAETGSERIDRERDQGEKREWAILVQDRSGDEGGVFPPSLSRNLLRSLSILPKAPQNSADVMTCIFCLPCNLFIFLKITCGWWTLLSAMNYGHATWVSLLLSTCCVLLTEWCKIFIVIYLLFINMLIVKFFIAALYFCI